MEQWKPIFSVADIGGSYSAAADAESRHEKRRTRDMEGARSLSNVGQDRIGSGDASSNTSSEEFDKDITRTKAYEQNRNQVVVVHGLNRPLFHIDLTSALQSAIANVENRVSPGSWSRPSNKLPHSGE